jgi:hypothetical protein
MADVRKLTRQTRHPAGTSATVLIAPDDALAPLTVQWTSYAHDGTESPGEEGPLRWASNGRLPVEGDDALLFVDELGDPWAIVWATGDIIGA